MPWQNLIMKVPPSEKERGIGLMMVMFSSALVAGVVISVTSMVNNQTKERIMAARSAQRMVAYEFVRSTMTDPAAMRVSAIADPILRYCFGLAYGGAYGCIGGTNTDPPKLRSFKLTVPFSKNNKAVVIGSKSKGGNDGIYDNRGRLVPGGCKPASKCPWQVLTRYWAQCPNNAAYCAVAVRVFTIAHLVQNYPDDTGRLGFSFPNSKVILPSMAVLNAKELYDQSSFIMTSDVLNSKYMTCPPGSSLVGTTTIQDNNPAVKVPLNVAKCVCSQGYMQQGPVDPATKWPTCVMQTCSAAKGEVLSEIDANGEIKCKIPNEVDYECFKKATPSTGFVDCTFPYKMRGLKSGDDCLIVNDPVQGEIVDCDQMEINCCRQK